MNTRTLLLIVLSAAFGAGIVGMRAAIGAARARFERLRSWPRPGEAEEYPAGPRRVPLFEAGMAGPE